MAPYAGPKDLLTAREVAARLSISIRTVYRMLDRGQFPRPIRLGRRGVRWKTTDVQRYLEGLQPGP
jgi:prophage regulatory protein